MSRKRISWMLMLALIISLFSFGYADTATDTKLVILHTNDTHARILEGKSDGMGFAKLLTEITQVRAENPNVLLLDAGDTLHGQTFASLNKGENMVKLLNLMKYDAMTPGNHDFNYGQDQLLTLAGKMSFPLISANIKKTDGTRLLTPSLIKEMNGLKVGIFGLSTPETAYKTHPNNVTGLTFADPIAEAKAMVAELQDQTDIIVCLSHLGLDEGSEFTSKKVAEAVPGIDVIVDGHSHTVLKDGLKVGDTLIGQTGDYDKSLGVIELTFADGKVATSKASLFTKEQGALLTPDAAMATLIADLDKENKVITDVKVGTTAVALDGERGKVRRGETNLGNLITAAMLDATGAEVAFTNGGGIRASIDAGDITRGEVITVLPFGNYVVVKTVTGQDLLDALELGISKYPEENGPFPHVAGMTYSFDAGKPAGSRLLSATAKGAPIDPKGNYVLATNDFMAAGGDGYTMFADNKIQGEFPALDEILATYIGKSGAVSPVTDGRVKIVGTPAPAPAPAAPVTTPAAPVVTPGPVLPTVGATYTVKINDVLWKIAEQFKTDWKTLADMNKLQNPNLILPGQILTVPAQ